MLLTTYSRLGVTKLNQSNSTTYTSMWASINKTYMADAGLEEPTLYIYPLDVDGSEETILDPFEDRVVGTSQGGLKLSTMYHFRLPKTYTYYSQVDLQRAWLQAGGTSVFKLQIGEPPCYWHKYRSSYWGGTGTVLSWHGNDGLVVMLYSASWRSNSDTLRVSGRPWRFKVMDGKIYTKEPIRTQSFETVKYLPISQVDREYIRFLARNEVLTQWWDEEWSDWELSTNTLKTSLDISGHSFSGNWPVPTLFGEKARFLGMGFTDNSLDYDYLVQHAFYDACGEITKMNDNSIQNIIEMCKLVLSCCTGNVMSMTKLIDEIDGMLVKDVAKDAAANLPSTWLGYRYQIGTGISDVNQFSRYLLVKTEQWLNFLNQHYFQRSYGVATRVVKGRNVTCRCEIAWRPTTVSGLKYIMQHLHEWGLELNAYTLWDFVPLSFVADWVLPIGDTLDVMSNAKYLTEEYYDFDYCCFSLSYDMEGEILPGHRYYRWYQSPPVIEGYTWLSDRTHAKTKTWVKRGIDGVALGAGIIKSIH